MARKSNRLLGYDYSTVGAYFVTICSNNRKPLFSRIVGEGLAPPEIQLLPCGRIIKEQLENLIEKYPQVEIDQYVIMPNHIHLLLQITAGGASPSPTLSSVICTLKSMTARICSQQLGQKSIFQRSYYDHIIRGQEDYLGIMKYMQENPLKWALDELYVTGSWEEEPGNERV